MGTASTDDDDWIEYDFADEYDDEPIGSCDNCHCDVYEGDWWYTSYGEVLCDQCAWWRTKS